MPSRPSRPTPKRPQNANDNLDSFLGTDNTTSNRDINEDPFEDLSLDEVVNYDGSDATFVSPPSSKPAVSEDTLAGVTYNYFDEQMSEADKAKRNPSNQKVDAPTYDEEGQPVKADTGKKRLLPFGKKTVKLKEGKFDKRKNLRTQAIIIQSIVIICLVAIVGLGLKNAIFPPAGLSKQEVTDIAVQVSHATKFPVERGKSFAQDFIKVYLQVDPKNKEDNVKALAYFYTGTADGAISSDNAPGFSDHVSQKLLVGPNVYDIKVLNDSAAKVLVGAFVETKTEKTPKDGIKKQWVFFSVNVFYSSKTDKMSIAPNSPTLVANPAVGGAEDFSNKQEMNPLGTDNLQGNNDAAKMVKTTIEGFLNAYAKSTPAEHSAIDQYILNDPNVDQGQLFTGLGGQFVPQGGDASKTTNITAFVPDGADLKTITEMSTKVQVVWEQDIKSETPTKLSYKAFYVIKLQKSGGKWLIKSMSPYPYIPAPKKS